MDHSFRNNCNSIFLNYKQEDEKAHSISDLRMRAAKARECLDAHRHVLDRLRILQMNGPTPVVGVSSPTSDSSQYRSTSTARCLFILF